MYKTERKKESRKRKKGKQESRMVHEDFSLILVIRPGAVVYPRLGRLILLRRHMRRHRTVRPIIHRPNIRCTAVRLRSRTVAGNIRVVRCIPHRRMVMGMSHRDVHAMHWRSVWVRMIHERVVTHSGGHEARAGSGVCIRGIVR